MDEKKDNHHILYCKDAKNKLRYWQIYSINNVIEIEFGVVGGSPIFDSEVVPCGLAGRSIAEQVESRVLSRVNKKTNTGYCRSLEEAESKSRTNSMGLARPMLAKAYKDAASDQIKQMYAQYKYDGHRCLIKNEGGKIIAYSRNGKPIESIDHITDGIKLPLGVTIDGELYAHGVPLQTITSWVKKKQKDTQKLSFICYDVIANNCYSIRLNFIESLILGDHSFVAETKILTGNSDIPDLLQKSIEDGFEGLILRPLGYHYEDGKRSKGLIKVKKFFDDEYTVFDITASVDGHAILHCKHNGKKFSTLAPGKHTEKINIYTDRHFYIGKKVNIKYANLTKDNVPFHPIATMWRNKDEE